MVTRASDRLDKALGVLVALPVGLIVVLTFVDVFARYLFAAPIRGSLEIIEFAMALAIFAALPLVTRDRGHVTVTLVDGAVPRAWRPLHRALCDTIGAAALALLSWRLAAQALDDVQAGTQTIVLHLPKAPARVRDECARGLVGAADAVAGLAQLAASASGGGRPMTAALIGFAVLLLLAFAGVPLAFAMLLTGVGGFALLRGVDPALGMLGQIVVDSAANYGMSVLPMFILMGLFVHKAEIGNELYDAANAWLGHLRGGLAHATVAACGLFAAISGSSIATAATMTKVAIPPMRRLGYHDRLSTGAVASAGVLGVLIPPSVPLVIFGLLTETDIRKLFIATIVPGLVLLLLFFFAVWWTVARNPALGPRGERLPLRQRFAALKGIWSTLLLFVLVMGGLYGGVFTATECAGIGASGALLIALARRRLAPRALLDCLVETGRTTAMIFAIVFGALAFANFITLTGMTAGLVAWIQQSGLGTLGVLLAMIAIYLVLGALMEAMGLLLLTAPIFTAVAIEMGVNPIWFGIFVVMLIEIGMLTPPVGMNVFTVKSLLPEVPLSTIFRGVLPFLVANLVAVAIIVAWPQLVLAPLRWF